MPVSRRRQGSGGTVERGSPVLNVSVVAVRCCATWPEGAIAGAAITIVGCNYVLDVAAAAACCTSAATAWVMRGLAGVVAALAIAVPGLTVPSVPAITVAERLLPPPPSSTQAQAAQPLPQGGKRCECPRLHCLLTDKVAVLAPMVHKRSHLRPIDTCGAVVEAVAGAGQGRAEQVW